jgi:hypothetical protein
MLCSKIISDRALRHRLSTIEKFSDDGLPYFGIDLSNNKELYENYLDLPQPLTISELVHVKLIAISLNHLKKDRRTNRSEFKDTYNMVLRLLLSMSYVPTLEQLHSQDKANSKKS